MGWNSWDCYGTTVTEAELLANARFMRDRLLSFGWDARVIDAAWFDPTARSHGYNDDAPFVLDDEGRQTPALNRFPSATADAGFRPLADELHAMGLRFGLHLMRGIPRLAAARSLVIPGTDVTTQDIADSDDTCAWNPDNFGFRLDHPVAQTWIDRQIRLYADWGVDYLKIDDLLDPYDRRHIDAYAAAVARCGRPITLSLSPRVDLPLTVREHVQRSADLWRISGDVWDDWADVAAQFDRLAMWAPTQGGRGWADADMLPLGRIGIRAERGHDRSSLLTDAEQQSLFTLWCIGRSPLMMGGDLPTSSLETITMLTHTGLLELHRLGRRSRQVLRTGDTIVWVAEEADGPRTWAAVFHTGEEPTTLDLPPSALRVPDAPQARLIDVWTGEAMAGTDRLGVPPHGCRLLRFDPL